MTNNNTKHLWQSTMISDEQLMERLPELSSTLANDLQYRLKTITLTDACTRMINQIKSNQVPELKQLLLEVGQTESQAENILLGICHFMHKDNIMARLHADLGSYHPFDFDRTDYDEPVFEAWKPLGVQVHVVPGNAVNVPVLSILEGLMAGNINILKNTARNGLFAQRFMQALIACDDTGILQHFVYMFELSSSQQDIMQQIINQADVVCVWGGEEAVKSITAMTPPGIRVVDWGHKISFAYVAASMINNQEALERLAADICRRNQQACTSPQCVLVESTDTSVLDRFSVALSSALQKVNDQFPKLKPSIQEQAEISTIKQLHITEVAQGMGSIITAADHSYNVLVDYRMGLQPSPLFRTIWVKPIQREAIISTLRPFNLYLQTCGLATDNLTDAYELTELLIRAGVHRVTEIGKQHEAYIGEPHDGVYALQRYTKKVAVRYDPTIVSAVPNFIYLQEEAHVRNLKAFPITDKNNRQDEVNPAAKMYLKSGGSSGVTKIAGYSWQDWDEQIRVMGESYYIGGVRPKDKCAILFSAGNMYGGFIATQKALEHINATSITISSNLDTPTIADTILTTQPNVIMGMPSFLRKLFREEYHTLKQYKGFEKLMYGGELMTPEQQEWFKNEFGFQEISSPVYASNDALINGYACKHCSNGAFHVPTKVMDMEIVKMESTEPVEGEEVGRILITKKSIKDPELIRYDIGDLGRWITSPCACGHKTPKFQLMGRYGDLVRCGAKFINYREIAKHIITHYQYTDDIQMVIHTDAAAADVIEIKLLETIKGKETEITQSVLAAITDLRYAVEAKNAVFKIVTCPIADFEIAKASGKVRPIVDLRVSL
jgi:phenylacetate-coenzyme A ligase PaaK-like adenylate-forming protein